MTTGDEWLDCFIAEAHRHPDPRLDDRLATHADAATQPVLLLDQGGVGAAVLARFAARRRAAGEPVAFHHAGLLAGYAEPSRFLWSLLVQLRAIAALPQWPPLRQEALHEVLPNWLARASARGRLWLLVADIDTTAAPDGVLTWLPRYWPPNVRIAGSSAPGACAEQLRASGWQVLDATPAAAAQHPVDPAAAEPIDGDALASTAGALALARTPLRAADIGVLSGNPAGRVERALGSLRPRALRLGPAGWAATGSGSRRWLQAQYPLDEYRRPRLLEALAEHADALTAAAYFRQAWQREAALERLLDRDTLAATADLTLRVRWLAEWDALRAGSLADALLPVLLVANQALLLAAGDLVDAVDEPVPEDWLERAAEGADPVLAARARLRQAQSAARREDWVSARQRAEQAAVAVDDPDILAGARNLRARAAEALGDAERAVQLYEAAVAEQEERHGDDAAALLPALANLVAVLRAAGRWARARGVAERAVAIARRRCGADHPDTATACDQLAAIAYAGADYAAAEAWYRETLATVRVAFGPSHPATAAALHNLGTVLDARRAFVESEQCYREALAIREAAYGRESEETAATLHNLAAVLETTGRLDEAERLYRETTDIWERLYGAEHPATMSSLTNLAGVLATRGAYADAEVCYRAAAEGWRRLVGDAHPNTLNALAELGRMYADAGRPELGGPLLEHVVETGQQVLGTADVNYVNSVCSLAAVWRGQGRRHEARELVAATLLGAERKLGLIAPPVVQLRRQLDVLDGVVVH